MTQIPQQPPDDVLAWLRGRTPEELGAIEAHEPCASCLGRKPDCADCGGAGKAHTPRIFFPEAVRRRGPTGKIVEDPIYLVLPREDELALATREAVAHVAKAHPKKTIETPAQARELIGEIRWELLEDFAIVGLCVRSRQPPHIRAYKLHVLLGELDPTTLNDLFGRIEVLRKLWDVRVSHLTEEQFWAFGAEVARVKNTSPLAVLAPGLHGPFTTRLAIEHHAYRTCKSCSGCKEHSMPE